MPETERQSKGMSALSPSDRFVVGISGGLSSAVTAALLQEQGVSILGVHVFNSHSDRNRFRCGRLDRRQQAREVCESLGIPWVEVDSADLFNAQVMDSLVHDSVGLKAPEPCYRCHREVLLEILLQEADRQGGARIATGHQAQLIQDATSGRLRLLEGTEPTQDQSYWLSSLTAEQLARWFLPLGTIPKDMVLRLTAQSRLPKFLLESPQGAHSSLDCFGSDPEAILWLNERVAPSLRLRGFVRDSEERVLDEHEGLLHHRVGSPWTGRTGGAGRAVGGSSSANLPDSVIVELDSARNLVHLGPPTRLLAQRALLKEVRWLHPGDRLKETFLEFRLTPGAPLQKAWVLFHPGQTLRLETETPIPGLIPGGRVVFQQGSEILGQGRIDQVLPIV